LQDSGSRNKDLGNRRWSYGQREIMHETGLSLQAVQREL